MKKVYRIYELVSTSLESKSVCEEFGYGRKTLNSFLYREIDDTSMGWEKQSELIDGFETLEKAEEFITKNIDRYDQWTIICEYEKEI